MQKEPDESPVLPAGDGADEQEQQAPALPGDADTSALLPDTAGPGAGAGEEVLPGGSEADRIEQEQPAGSGDGSGDDDYPRPDTEPEP